MITTRTKPVDNIKISTIEDIAYIIKQAKNQNLPRPIVFLGAGASKTAGIPLACEIINDIQKKYKDNPRIKSLKAELISYPTIMECLTPFERNELLNGYIDKAKINVTHIYLAQLLIEDYVDYVLTVNFDNLMLRSLALFNNFPATYDLSNLKDLTTTCFKEKSVVYLHGQHHGLWLLNTDEEMRKVTEIIPPILNSIKNQRAWIFIGYSGEDPIFEHITKLGTFANGLYWVSYYNERPNETVCRKLLEKPLTNTFLIEGYDADSFMLKLNSELGLNQPLILDKPFTSLKNIIENVVDVDDKEHFKGVKERLEIVKKNVKIAIQQFEEGNVESNKNLKEEIDINILKKEIIDKIILKEENKGDIKILEEKVKRINIKEINSLMSQLLSNIASNISFSARLKNNVDLYKPAFDEFEKAIEFDSFNEYAWFNWGTSLYHLATLNNDEILFKQSFDKFEKAANLNPKGEANYSNWGVAIYDLAKLKNSEILYKQSFVKFKKATQINPKSIFANYNWGLALYDLAVLTKDESFYKQCFNKFKIVTKLRPTDDIAYSLWGAAIYDLAALKKEEKLYKESLEKYKKSLEINPNNYITHVFLGIILSVLAKINKNNELFEESFMAFQNASKLKPNDSDIYNNWGRVLLDLGKLEKNEETYSASIEMLEKAVELGGSSYNLACVYANLNNKGKALDLLEKSLQKNEIETSFVEKDDDWENFENDTDFINLLQKYNSQSTNL